MFRTRFRQKKWWKSKFSRAVARVSDARESTYWWRPLNFLKVLNKQRKVVKLSVLLINTLNFQIYLDKQKKVVFLFFLATLTPLDPMYDGSFVWCGTTYFSRRTVTLWPYGTCWLLQFSASDRSLMHGHLRRRFGSTAFWFAHFRSFALWSEPHICNSTLVLRQLGHGSCHKSAPNCRNKSVWRDCASDTLGGALDSLR